MKFLIITLALLLGFRIGELYAAGGGGGHGGGGPKAQTGTVSGATNEGTSDSPHASLALKFSEGGSSLN